MTAKPPLANWTYIIIWLCIALSTMPLNDANTRRRADDNSTQTHLHGNYSQFRSPNRVKRESARKLSIRSTPPTWNSSDFETSRETEVPVTSHSKAVRATTYIPGSTSQNVVRTNLTFDTVETDNNTKLMTSYGITNTPDSVTLGQQGSRKVAPNWITPISVSGSTYQNEHDLEHDISTPNVNILGTLENVTFISQNSTSSVLVSTGPNFKNTTSQPKEESEKGIFSQRAVDNLWYVCHGILGTIIEIIGVTGNIMCIIVLIHPNMRSSTSILLTSLAIYDIVLLTSYFFLMSLHQILKYTRFYASFEDNFHQPTYPVWFSLTSIAFMGSSYTTVAISIERFLVVWFPLKAAAWCTELRARVTTMAVFVLVISYNIPRYMVFNLKATWNDESNTTIIKSTKTDFSRSTFYEETYSVTMNIVVKVFLPLAVLMTCSCLMIKAVVTKSIREVNQNPSCTNLHRFTSMAAAVMGFSMISLLTGAAEVILLRIHHTQFSEANACEIVCSTLSALSELIAILNSGANFLLFCVFGSKFREVCRKRFCSRSPNYHPTVMSLRDKSQPIRTSSESSTKTSIIRDIP